MKKLFFTAFLMLALARLAPAQPVSSYTNNNGVFGFVQVDATNFFNNASFEISFSSYTPYDFLDVLMYSNRSLMYCSTGFTFDRKVQDPFGQVTSYPANIFGNANQGQVVAGVAGASPLTFDPVVNLSPVINIMATNVVNTGLLETDPTGVIEITGNNLDLRRGTMFIEGFDNLASGTDFLSVLTNIANLGIATEFYGIGNQSNLLSLASFTLPLATAPASKGTLTPGVATTLIVTPPNPVAYSLTTAINASNVYHQVVILNTNLAGVGVSVRFDPSATLPTPTVNWEAVVTNITGAIITNDLYLQDNLGGSNSLGTNGYTLSGIPQFGPTNYVFTRTFPGFNLLTAPDPGYDPTTIFAAAFKATNLYSVYEVQVQPTAFAPDLTAVTATVTNLPGRVVLTATGPGSYLDLSRATVTGPNYFALNATNDFRGTSNAQIVVPNMDLNLGSISGSLAISNLVAPLIPRFTGLISMYSATWTKVDTNGFTNGYHVLFVSSSLSPTSPVAVQNLLLRSTNMSIYDNLNVISNVFLNGSNLTLGTNALGSQLAAGALILENPTLSWPDSAPTLQNFTNFGTFETFSATLNFSDLSGAPYNSFVNHGVVFAGGISINANYFENSGFGGFLESLTGPLFITAGDAVLSGGQLFSPSDLTIATGSLEMTNSFISLTGSLNLIITNSVSDGGAFSGDSITVADGINLLQKPATGDFLGTTMTLTAPAGLEVNVTWAGLDLGRAAAGFTNNIAIGHLILDGATKTSDFAFGGPDTTNHYAIYVDQLELRDGSTNRSSQGGAQSFTAFTVAPNMKIYFADAIIGGLDISEKMNGANNGQLVWVPAYAGTFSGILVNADNFGHTILANRALAQSQDIDSNGNGIFNFFDTVPFFTAFQLNFGVALTNLPPRVPVVTWTTIPNSTNILYASTNLAATNWSVVTNFVAGGGSTNYNSTTKTARVVDQTPGNGPKFYKVQVNAAQP